MQEFVDWCEQSFLQLNIARSKNICIDFRRHTSDKDSTSIKGQTVECVGSYAYLGATIDSKLTFVAHCEFGCEKANQRLHCRRRLSSFRVDRKLLTMLYRCFQLSLIFLLAWCPGSVPLPYRTFFCLLSCSVAQVTTGHLLATASKQLDQTKRYTTIFIY